MNPPTRPPHHDGSMPPPSGLPLQRDGRAGTQTPVSGGGAGMSPPNAHGVDGGGSSTHQTPATNHAALPGMEMVARPMSSMSAGSGMGQSALGGWQQQQQHQMAMQLPQGVDPRLAMLNRAGSGGPGLGGVGLPNGGLGRMQQQQQQQPAFAPQQQQQQPQPQMLPQQQNQMGQQQQFVNPMSTQMQRVPSQQDQIQMFQNGSMARMGGGGGSSMPPPPQPSHGTPVSNRAELIPPMQQLQQHLSQAQQQQQQIPIPRTPAQVVQGMPGGVAGGLPPNAQQHLAMIHQAHASRMGQQQQQQQHPQQQQLPPQQVVPARLGGAAPTMPTMQQVIAQLSLTQREQLAAMPEAQQRQQVQVLQVRLMQNMMQQQAAQAQAAQAQAVLIATSGAPAAPVPGVNVGGGGLPNAGPTVLGAGAILPGVAQQRPIAPMPHTARGPVFPQHLMGKLDPRMTSITALPFVKDADDVTHGGALPTLSDEEINRVKGWIAKDKEYIKIVAEDQVRRERFQKEGLESVGKPKWWEVGEMERRTGNAAGNGVVPGSKLAVLWPEDKRKLRRRKIGRAETRL